MTQTRTRRETTATPVADPPVRPQRARTLGALLLLQGALPFNLATTAIALARGLVTGDRDRPVLTGRRTVLVSGGKMTKALTLARAFHRAGHRVVLVESAKYRLTGHRFSRCVDAFHVVPPVQDPGYAQALADVVIAEKVDVYVPVCSPAASCADAEAKPLLEKYCEVVHADADVIARLDDKYQFARLADTFGLTTPDTHLVTDPDEVADFDFAHGQPPYVLKSIAYDPVHRLDLTPLPRPTPQQTAAFATARPISDQRPWILQTLVKGTEYCTHATVRDGRVTVFACCPSSAFQVNYEMVDRPAIEAWVREFLAPLHLTGQVSFDFMQTADGTVYPIECNPRTHSAITMFADHPGLAGAYLDPDAQDTVVPLPTSRPTYWLYHELWRMLSRPASIPERLRVIARGTDAIYDRRDPLPFLLVHHLQIPLLLLRNLVAGRPWIRIDFNIGKLVEPAGD